MDRDARCRAVRSRAELDLPTGPCAAPRTIRHHIDPCSQLVRRAMAP